MMRSQVPGSKALTTTRVLLLRHAETSAPDRFHGAESDIGLGARGFLQAEAVARRLATEQPSAVVSSAMLRARQTAEPIAAACGRMVTVEPLLHERKMGPLSGVSRDAGLDAYGQAKARWMAGDLAYTHEGGESFEAIRDRALPVFRRLVETCQAGTLVVVSHGVVIRVLLTSILPEYSPAHFDQFAIDNTGINDLRWDGATWSAVALNCRTHLGQEGDDFAW
jgi:2,3-bisphosphoglycerate-dependent phosphoglycerate mutase